MPRGPAVIDALRRAFDEDRRIRFVRDASGAVTSVELEGLEPAGCLLVSQHEELTYLARGSVVPSVPW